jgi:eukaryotic-like serine/threonine-protein kinase
MTEEEERTIAGRYRLIEELGSGGMGVVWHARDERLRREVAVKQVRVPAELTAPEGEEMVRRTMREGRIAARLHHPQLITVYDVVQDGGQPYLIMEYFPAKSLEKSGVVPYTEAARIGAEAAAALAAAHEAGVVHRDVKPANVLIGKNGEVKITDFGISRVVSDLTLTATSTFAGTPAYLAPEIARGSEATFASDVYSLGATLYAAVEGVSPAGDDTNAMKLLYKVSTGKIDPPKQAGPLTDVLMWLLSDDPEKRPSMTEARNALAAVHEPPAEPVAVPVVPATLPVAPAPAAEEPPAETPAAAPATRQNRKRAAAVAAGLLAVAVVAALVTLLLNRQETPSNADGGTPASTSSSSPATAEERSSATTTTETTTTTTPPTASSTTPPPQQPPPPAAAATPLAAVTEYYGMMPANREQAWTRLTAKFQNSPAGGKAGYERFWSGIRSVTASDASQTGENTVRVTLLYVRTDGSQSRELHNYTLVNENGMWLIDSVRRENLAPA